MEQKYQIGNKYGSIMWDIDAILQHTHEFTLKDFSIERLAAENNFNGDLQYAMTTDTSKPLIVVQLNNIYDKLIDGNHRLQKCIQEGKAVISAYYLSFTQHSNYIVDFNPDIYWEVVNHWDV